jgi:hypothetical protein
MHAATAQRGVPRGSASAAADSHTAGGIAAAIAPLSARSNCAI